MTTRLSWPRDLISLVAVSVALVLQLSVLAHTSWHGVVPDLVLLVVVAAALAHGTEYAVLVGFGAGLLLDLAPPADAVAGRWALALVVVGYVAGRLRAGQPALVERRVAVLALVGACSFVGTSVYALTGLVLHDHAVGVPALLSVVGASVLLDLVAAVLVVPVVVGCYDRARPDHALAR